MLTKNKDSACRWSIQLGRDPGSAIMQKVPQLPCRMVDSHYMAGSGCGHCICSGDFGARSSNSESSKL